MKDLGFEVMHVYGLTETYGHVTQCAWNDGWNEFDEEKKNEIKARQGVRYPNTEGVTIMDPKTMKKVWNEGYFEKVLKNLQFNDQTQRYDWVNCNPTLAKQNTQVDEEHEWF